MSRSLPTLSPGKTGSIPEKPSGVSAPRPRGWRGDGMQPWISLLLGAAAWEVSGRMLQLSFLPPFSSVLRAAMDLIISGQILGNLRASLIGLAIGFGLAVSSGVMTGLMMGRYRAVETMLEPFVNAFLAAPRLVFVPILYALFGVGRGVQVGIVFLSAFFVIVVNTMGGIQQVSASHVEMARSFGAGERQLLLRVLLPGALPMTMAGLRLGMGRAVKGMISGEMFIALFGMGALLRTYGSRFDSAKVFAILLIIVIVALVCSYAVALVERRLTRWMEPAA